MLTVWKRPPERMFAIALDIEGFSATHRTRMGDDSAVEKAGPPREDQRGHSRARERRHVARRRFRPGFQKTIICFAFMSAMENPSTTRLLTLLNVSATKYGGRKWSISHGPAPKLNRRKSGSVSVEPPESTTMEVEPQEDPAVTAEKKEEEDAEGMCI